MANKKPHIVGPPPLTKKAISKWPSDDESHIRLSWRLGDMEQSGPWPWKGIKGKKWREILTLLAEMEKLTWPKATSGYTPRVKEVSVADAPSHAMKRLIDTQRDDIDSLAEIRMSAKQRIWGVRRGNVCHLLWWDPNHQVWPSKKKHT